MSAQALPDRRAVVVRIGSRVKVADEDGLSEFVIVTPDQADLVSGLVSAESAMGRAVLGRPVGAQATVETRFGQRRVWIVAAGEDGA